MMDEFVVTTREALYASRVRADPIMSYALKYASGLYGPFRETEVDASQKYIELAPRASKTPQVYENTSALAAGGCLNDGY